MKPESLKTWWKLVPVTSWTSIIIILILTIQGENQLSNTLILGCRNTLTTEDHIWRAELKLAVLETEQVLIICLLNFSWRGYIHYCLGSGRQFMFVYFHCNNSLITLPDVWKVCLPLDTTVRNTHTHTHTHTHIYIFQYNNLLSMYIFIRNYLWKCILGLHKHLSICTFNTSTHF